MSDEKKEAAVQTHGSLVAAPIGNDAANDGTMHAVSTACSIAPNLIRALERRMPDVAAVITRDEATVRAFLSCVADVSIDTIGSIYLSVGVQILQKSNARDARRSTFIDGPQGEQ